MLFAVHYANKSHGDEARDKRTNKLLAAWKPPAGFEMKSWYDPADGSGGVAIVDAASAQALLEAVGLIRFSGRFRCVDPSSSSLCLSLKTTTGVEPVGNRVLCGFP